MTDRKEGLVLKSWAANADAWARAVQQRTIASRVAVTDQSIVEAITACRPKTVLDIGCGEGWLVRALESAGIGATGIDAIPALIETASAYGRGRYEVATYQDVADGQYRPAELFEAAVCNFSLLGNESVRDLIGALPRLLEPGGFFILQTLHPLAACGRSPYRDGWREGSWEGLGPGFKSPPAPWYFRTIDSWTMLLVHAGFDVLEVREPVVPGSIEPSSIIFVARLTGGS